MTNIKKKSSSKKLKISASSLKTYQTCPRKYYYTYIEKRPKKSWPHLVLGNFVHAVLEEFHNRLLKDDSLSGDELGQLLSAVCKEKVASYRMTQDQRASSKKMLKTYLDNIKRDGLPPVLFNEKSFNIELENDIVIRGFIDRVDSDDERGYHIVDYKGLAIDTPIPTPTGWTTMGELQKGDLVLGSDGNATTVTAKSGTHHRPCYRLTLSDKSTIVCDNVHMWSVGLRDDQGLNEYDDVLSADELFERFSQMNESESFIIENPAPLQFSERFLPIDPWLLGVWLGDRHNEADRLTVPLLDCAEMQELITQRWNNIHVSKIEDCERYEISCNRPFAKLCEYGHDISSGPPNYCASCLLVHNEILRNGGPTTAKWNVSLRTVLKQWDLLDNKHIPIDYLRASFEQRLDLLQGLMDINGSWDSVQGQANFTSENIEFINSVAELVRTFGTTAMITAVKNGGESSSYELKFTPIRFNPFKIPRRAKEVGMIEQGSPAALCRTIVNIESIKTVPTECIAVDASDSLYICGSGMTLSHNTGKSKYLDEFQLLIYGLYLLNEHPDLEHYKGSYLMLGEGSKLLSYTFTRTDLERCIKDLNKMAEQIRTDKTWEAKPQFLCSFCDFEKFCPATQADVPFIKTGTWE